MVDAPKPASQVLLAMLQALEKRHEARNTGMSLRQYAAVHLASSKHPAAQALAKTIADAYAVLDGARR